MSKTKVPENKERCVLVTTAHKGVFCGYAKREIIGEVPL